MEMRSNTIKPKPIANRFPIDIFFNMKLSFERCSECGPRRLALPTNGPTAKPVRHSDGLLRHKAPARRESARRAHCRESLSRRHREFLEIAAREDSSRPVAHLIA